MSETFDKNGNPLVDTSAKGFFVDNDVAFMYPCVWPITEMAWEQLTLDGSIDLDNVKPTKVDL